MAKQVALEAQLRDGLGKEKAKKLRNKGLVPAEFYGKGTENVHILVNHRDFEKAVRTSESKLNSIFSLSITNSQGEKKEEIVFLREYQRDPITDFFIHLDFLKVDTKQPISVKVPIKLVGECPALKEGLVLAQAMHELPLKCLPLEIPNYIEIELSSLQKAHDAIRVSDLKIPGVTIELPAGQEIVHAEVPRELKVEEETPAPESAEVPTTAQGKPEEEGKAGEEGAAKKPEGKPGAEAKKPEAKAGEAKKPEAKAAGGAKPEAKK